jgi:hypothetical protein
MTPLIRDPIPARLLAALLIAAVIGGVSISARANSPTGSVNGRSLRVGSLHTQRFVSPHGAHGFRHFHHRDRDDFAGGFFPFGFWPSTGWPDAEPDLAAADGADGFDWRMLRYWRPVERYQPPTVEKTPSGVTIIRGPGSSHRLVP